MVNRVQRHVPAIHLVREIDLVGAAAVVVGAAGADGEAQGHRLQRSRLVAGNLEALDLRSERDAVVPNRLGRAAAALGQQIAEALAAADQLDRAQHGVAAPEREPGLVEPSAFDTLHGEGDGAARADRVDAQLVAETWMRGARHQGRSRRRASPAQTGSRTRAGRRSRRRSRRCARTRWCRRRSWRASVAVGGADLLGRDAGGPFERAALKVARRQRAEAIERQQIGRGPELAVFGGGGTERPF